MSSINRVILIGNVGKTPEIRSTQDGKEIASFSIATSESWKDRNGERQTKTEWTNIVVFNESLVKVVKSYVKKGSKLYIEGALQARKWTDKDGADRYSTEVVLKAYNGSIVLLDKKEDDAPEQMPAVTIDDEIAF
jgi:single-strand DNA-binding protein